MNLTKEYIVHHKKVFSLKKWKKKHRSKPKALIGGSVFRLLKFHIMSVIRCIIYFPIGLYQGKNFLSRTYALSKSAKKNRALVIGNGPSQGCLSAHELDQFVKSGGETYCVNYWNQNKKLSKHIPTWMVFSDPFTFHKTFPRSVNLIKYLKKNHLIKIIVPTSYIKQIQSLEIKNEIYCFLDVELSIWKNINPLLPRGYISITLFKALAWSIYLGYKSIGVIGMDNTLPKNIYNDKYNRVHCVENNAGSDNRLLVDVSSYHLNVSSYYYDVFRIFDNLDYFPNKNIVNLDIYSLTDRFKKVSKKSFLK